MGHFLNTLRFRLRIFPLVNTESVIDLFKLHAYCLLVLTLLLPRCLSTQPSLRPRPNHGFGSFLPFRPRVRCACKWAHRVEGENPSLESRSRSKLDFGSEGSSHGTGALAFPARRTARGSSVRRLTSCSRLFSAGMCIHYRHSGTEASAMCLCRVLSFRSLGTCDCHGLIDGRLTSVRE